MKSINQIKIQQAFTEQANEFESEYMNFSNKNYLHYLVQKVKPSKSDSVLEIASGTCACGRAIAPYSKSVVCLDMTPAMLSIGKMASEKDGIENITFVLGDAAGLPFPDNSFDIVLSRLAFHHFPDVKQPFAEMVRVLKPCGKLVLIDMESAEQSLRETEDNIERMRDPSHVHNLSKNEMLELYRKHGFSVTCCEVIRMPMVLQNWLNHTKTPELIQNKIKTLMHNELSGKKKTGFSPYCRGGEILFDQRWLLIIGIPE